MFNPSNYSGISENRIASLRKAYLSEVYNRGRKDRKRKRYSLILFDFYRGNDMEAIETYMKAYIGE